MQNKPVVTLAACALILSILACNAPLPQSNNQPDYLATITAQAALLAQTGSQVTSTPGSDQAEAPTPSSVTASVTAATNCRTGPGTAFNLVTTLNSGQKVIVVGQDTPDNYWIVDSPNGRGICWLWGQYVAVTGDTAGLPQVPPSAAASPAPRMTKTPKPTAMATATAKPTSTTGPLPADPGDVTVGRNYCNLVKTKLGVYNYQMSFYIMWDAATDQTIQGFRIYRDGSLLATVNASATVYTDNITIEGVSAINLPVVDHKYGVESFNQFGASRRYTGHSQCP